MVYFEKASPAWQDFLILPPPHLPPSPPPMLFLLIGKEDLRQESVKVTGIVASKMPVLYKYWR